MTKLRFLAVACLALAFMSGCKKDDSRQTSDNQFVSNFTFLSGSQVFPKNSSAGTGTVAGTLDRKTKLYSYTLTYSGLSSNAVAIHVHGLAEKGYAALPIPLGPYTNGIFQNITSGFTAGTSGSYTGSFTVDGVVIRESDFLSGKYYIDVHTVNYPLTGEIRAQLTFNN